MTQLLDLPDELLLVIFRHLLPDANHQEHAKHTLTRWALSREPATLWATCRTLNRVIGQLYSSSVTALDTVHPLSAGTEMDKFHAFTPPQVPVLYMLPSLQMSRLKSVRLCASFPPSCTRRVLQTLQCNDGEIKLEQLSFCDYNGQVITHFDKHDDNDSDNDSDNDNNSISSNKCNEWMPEWNCDKLEVSQPGRECMRAIGTMGNVVEVCMYHVNVRYVKLIQHVIENDAMIKLHVSLDFGRNTRRLSEEKKKTINDEMGEFGKFLWEEFKCSRDVESDTNKNKRLKLISLTSTCWGSLQSQALLSIVIKLESEQNQYVKRCKSTTPTTIQSTPLKFEIQTSPSEIDIFPEHRRLQSYSTNILHNNDKNISLHRLYYNSTLTNRLDLATLIRTIIIGDGNNVLSLVGANKTHLHDHGRLRTLHTAFDMTNLHTAFAMTNQHATLRTALACLGRKLEQLDVSITPTGTGDMGVILRNLSYTLRFLGHKAKYALHLPAMWARYAMRVEGFVSLLCDWNVGVRCVVLKNEDGEHGGTYSMDLQCITNLVAFVKCIVLACGRVHTIYMEQGVWVWPSSFDTGDDDKGLKVENEKEHFRQQVGHHLVDELKSIQDIRQVDLDSIITQFESVRKLV